MGTGTASRTSGRPGGRGRAQQLPIGPAGCGYVCGDGEAIVRAIPADSVHLILSDIPYGIGLADWDVLHANTNSAYLGQSPAQARAGAVFKRRGKPINGWSTADDSIPRQYYDFCARWAGAWLRALLPGGSALVFAGRRLAARCVVALEDAGFRVRDLLGWVRPEAAHRAQRVRAVFDRRGDAEQAARWDGWRLGNLRPVFEPIIWAFKPYKSTIADNLIEHGVGAYDEAALRRYFGSVDNVLSCGFAPGEAGLHPAQKPQRLFEGLIALTTRPGQLVLDPFAGSGTAAVAARALGRRYLAIERDPDLCALIAKRLAGPAGPQPDAGVRPVDAEAGR